MILTFFMDGVKYDMMQKYMPFLSSLNTRPMLSELGYSCACHATMYTGKYVEEHGTWFIWKKGENSPYKWVDKVPFLKYMNILPLKLFIGKLTNKLSNNSSYSGVPCLVNLPLKYWSMFEPCDTVMWNDPEWKKEIPNLFTILQENKVEHEVIALHKRTGPDDAFIESKGLDFDKNEFVYYFIGYTDNMMHQYGEDNKSKEYLYKVDAFIKQEYEKALATGKDVQVIAFSDHGHMDIYEEKVDINKFFKKTKVNDYVHLIESNYARFWPRNDEEKDEILTVLQAMESLKMGFIITPEVKNEYHLNLNPAEHGEIIFYLDAPYEFTNTIWGFGKSVVSGHGFLPSYPKHHGIFCTNCTIDEQCDFARLTDILPTILDFLNISKDYNLVGNNLISK